MWPMFFMVQELPPKMRIQPRWMLFAGLWFDVDKPAVSTFFQPVIQEMRSLSNGIEVQLPCGQVTTSKVKVLSGVFDSPAKAMVLEQMLYSGDYGCSFCTEKGKTHKVSERGHLHIYPFNNEEEAGFAGQRTHQSVMKAASDAIAEGNRVHVLGIKSLSPLAGLPYLDLVAGIAFDYMHTVTLGTVKMLLELWTYSAHKKEPWYVGNNLQEIDQRLLAIKPPNSITRTPRSISENLKHWKASELRAWLLHYSLPCLYNILPEEYFQHFALLVEGIYLLNKSSVSSQDLATSRLILKNFCKLLPDLYAVRYQRINVHLLLHAADCVVNLGPLWAQSCYPFEDWNGTLTKLFHGTQHIHTQILAAVKFHQHLPAFIKSVERNPNNLCLLKKLTNQRKSKATETTAELAVLGALQLVKYPGPELRELLNENYQRSTNIRVLTFARCLYNNQVYTSTSYKRAKKRNSYTVVYERRDKTHSVGKIQFYVKVEEFGGQAVYFAVLQNMGNEDLPLVQTFGHILSLSDDNEEHEMVLVNAIQQKCVLALSDGKCFVSPLCNIQEAD